MYPCEILPQQNYHLIDSEKLCKNYDVYIIRRSSLPEPLGSDGKVKFDALIETDREDLFYDLSWNLLGIFKAEHAKYIVKVQDSKEWKSGDDIPFSEQIPFQENESPVIYLQCKAIYNYPFLYTNKELKEKAETSKQGIVLLEHKPLNVNFWHFQFLVKKETGEAIKNASSKKWTKDAVKKSQIKILLINNMSLSSPSKYDVCPIELYTA